MRHTAIILGAGSGTRMGGGQNKLLLKIGNSTVVERAVQAFYNHDMVSDVLLVCRENELEAFQELLQEYTTLRFTAGGGTRQQSVLHALKEVPADTELLLIHDGARPFVSKEVITRTVQAALKCGAAAAGVPVKDTIKSTDMNGYVTATPERASLYAVQTPQVFSYPLYLEAAAKAQADGVDLTDDCQMIERLGHAVKIVMGDYANLKITTKEDIPQAQSILSKEEAGVMRIGHGYDVHRLVTGRPLIIGGVKIEHPLGLLGHSDADVLLHAITDALLGAAAMGDIGTLFPDTDQEWKDADSLQLLKIAARKLKDAHYSVINIDATVLAQCPKLKPFIGQMREHIADACGIALGCVSVKATTEEGLGFTGMQEGIAAHAVALVQLN